MSLMKKLAGTHWGANHNVLKKMYTGRIRPTLEYGMAATCTASKSQKENRNKIQNQAMRIMTGAMCSTPISCLETITGLQSLEERCDIKVLTQDEKFKRLQNHPMSNITRRPKTRLLRTSFFKESKNLREEDPTLADQTPEPLLQASSLPPWKDHTIKIRTEIPGIESKNIQPEHVRKTVALDYLQNTYNQEIWTEVYTDGSATEATRDGGAGVYIKYNEGEARHSYAAGKYSSNYRAEAVAMTKAADELSSNANEIKPNVVILTDALSVLDGLKNGKEKCLDPLHKALAKLSSKANVTLQWIPAHCGIPGNEIADALAKEGSRLEQTDRTTTYQEVKTYIKRSSKSRWMAMHRDYSKSDPYYKLSREDQVVIFRLRTGHNRMNAHLRRIHLTPTDLCLKCGNAPMTSEHILQDCEALTQQRKALWPQETSYGTKLFGTLRDLQRAAKFVKDANITI